MEKVSLDGFLLFNESFNQQGEFLHNPEEQTTQLLATDGENFLDIDYQGNVANLVNKAYESSFGENPDRNAVMIGQITESEPVYEINSIDDGSLRYEGKEESFEWNIDAASAAGFLAVTGGEINVPEEMTVGEETLSERYGQLEMVPVSQRNDVLEFGLDTETSVDEYETGDFVDTEITGLTEDLEEVLDKMAGYNSHFGLPVSATYSDGMNEGEVFLGPLIGERSVKFLDNYLENSRFDEEGRNSYNIPSVASFARKVAEAEGKQILPAIEFTSMDGYPRSIPSASLVYIPEDEKLVEAGYGTVQELAMEDEEFKGGYSEEDDPIIPPVKLNLQNVKEQMDQNLEEPEIGMFQ